MDSTRGMDNKVLQLGGLLSRKQSQPKTLVSNQADVALRITKHLFLKEEYRKKNIVFSPLSLYVALSMVTAGSDGPTLDQLLTFLQTECTDHLNSFASHLASVVLRDAVPASGHHLCFTNGLWVDQSLSLQTSFKHLMTTYYNATLASVDFQNKAGEVINEVNLWAEEKTKGFIKDFLSHRSVDSSTRLILANALYFKGTWEDKFDALRTSDRDFHLLNGTSVNVPFMMSKEDQFISVFDGFKVLRLPYKHSENERQFSMYIFLPDANDGLSTLIEQVASKSRFLEYYFPHQKVKVGDFIIPKFKISFGLDSLADVMKEMGLVLPFSQKAEFTKVVESQKSLSISKIIHKSFIEVNEEGTEAAAATAILAIFGSSMGGTYPKVINFIADHPFFFLIREDSTGTILFTGQVLHPLDG